MLPRRLFEVTLVLCCELCFAIKVPIVWSDNSEVKNAKLTDEFSVENFKPEDLRRDVTTAAPIPIPVEYFEYTAKKPDFAVEVAAFHGVKSPEKHYHAYPIEPDTGLQKPVLGQHHMLDEHKTIYKPFQRFVEHHEGLKSHVLPTSSNYEVFHPYKAEEPALESIYKDPVLDKIRYDLIHTKDRLQNYEKEAGEPNITKDEYLESPEDTERKKFPHGNKPARFEVHNPQRHPIYYNRPPKFMQRERYLNKKFRHPLHQDYVKIKPVHYQPLKHQIEHFRQNQALKYDDEQNQYPQLPPPQNFAEPPEGYDIYEKGKSRYVNLRNNIDGAINNAVLHNRPTTYQKLEQFDNGKYRKGEHYHNPVPYDEYNEDYEVTTEFVPIKSYAQVRKTETTRHLPKKAALEEAANFEELKNAPRLREAVKSTKAQTVYSEEGYEDTAYDHAGEQKHASDHEGHGGYLKEHELSGGRYRIPSVNAAYSDGGGSISGDKTLHGEKWKNDDKDSHDENQEEDYADDDHEKLLAEDTFDENSDSDDQEQDTSEKDKNEESKETTEENEDEPISEASDDEEEQTGESVQHEVIKREADFQVPELDLNKTFFTDKDYAKIKNQKLFLKKDEVAKKYPYYFKNLSKVHRNSPLRYAEDLRLIPRKSEGGTEFYDSRSEFVCPEVDDEVDPIPEKIKNNATDTEKNEDSGTDGKDSKRRKRQDDHNETKKPQRLKNLGDKIDCFKAKYFGENPLDSPFFKEEIIANPDPIPLPNIASFKIKSKTILSPPKSGVFNTTENVKGENQNEFFKLLDSLKFGQIKLQESLKDEKSKFLASSIFPQNAPEVNRSALFQASVYTDVIDNIRKKIPKAHLSERIGKQLLNTNINETESDKNVSFKAFLSKESITKPPLARRKRAAQFVYEPYKIIHDVQVQDSKKTTTTGKISPLIRQLQSSRVVDKVNVFDKDQPVKRNVVTYKDIGRKEREGKNAKLPDSSESSRFVNVNVDLRRGEPRYEMKPQNHKPYYTPVDSKKAITLEEYTSLTNKTDPKLDTVSTHHPRGQARLASVTRKTIQRPLFDISKFIPRNQESQQISASKTIHRVIRTTTPAVKKVTSQLNERQDSSDSSESVEDEYEEYDDSEEEELPTTTTTTTTSKPSIRRKIRVRTSTSTSTTTPSPRKRTRLTSNVDNDQPTKLRLVTRFNKPQPSEVVKEETIKESPRAKETTLPKYREKTKKTAKSTLVTDTKSYGEDNDHEMQKDEVDAMIRVNQDMDDYVPMYEKQIEKKERRNQQSKSKDSEDSNEYQDDDHSGIDDEENDGESSEYEDGEPEESKPESVATTPEPIKRTLPRTTEAPFSTTETRRSKSHIKANIVKKKIEIHKELPVNKTTPHVSKFKQDIKEEEIIKELPRRRPNKHVEVLDLYKDNELAKKVNNLGDVEVFKENLDVRKGPRHGGNYRSAKIVEDNQKDKPFKRHRLQPKTPKESSEDAQSEGTKVVPIDEEDILVMKSQTRTKVRSNPQKLKGSNKNIELVELSEKITKPQLHGGNLKYENSENEPESEKIIELNENEEEDDYNNDDDYKTHESSKGYGRPLHGGNYRSSKLVEATTTSDVRTKGSGRKSKATSEDGHATAARVLNSYAQAVPILTTTPAYILDPSKRMYYYVDA